MGISAFGYEIKKNIQSIYQKKCSEEKHADLLSIRKGEKTLFSYQRF